MDYSLCNQTVTLYAKRNGEVTRQVTDKAYLEIEEGFSQDEHAPVRNFLLILPGPDIRVAAGDRVMAGIGPTEIDWDVFIPANVPNLLEVGRIRLYGGNGKIDHVEAEQAWN